MTLAMGATKPQRLLHAGVNGIFFGLCYLLANGLAHERGITRNVALAFEVHMPFLPWMVLPYLSSGLFFVAAFFVVRTRDDLRVLSQRMLVATVLAGLVFVLYPLHFSFARPPIATPWLATLFALLGQLDAPYNQLPSLHVAYCVIWWAALRSLATSVWTRAMLAAWLALMAVATLFTYQHHLLDVLAGFALGLGCVAAIRPGRTEPNVALYYLVAGGLAAVVGLAAWPVLVTAYLAASLWLVALAYWRTDRHFLHKRHGRHPWWVWCLYAPYLISYRLTWLAVVWRDRHRPAFRQVAPQLWTGRRLSQAEAAQLPADCTVFDLANELPETPALRAPHRHYRYFPLLDIVTPSVEAIDEIVAALKEETRAGRNVYVHCAMGQRRCAQIASAFLATIKP